MDSSNIKINPWCVFLFLILSSSCNFFYLFPNEIGNISLKDFSIILILLCFCCSSFYIFKSKVIFNKVFCFIEISTIILVLTSSYAALIHWRQPLWYGIRAQRLYLIYPFLLLIYLSLFKSNKINFKQIVKVLYTFSIIELFISAFQVFITPNFIFLNIQISKGGRFFGVPLRLYLEDSKYIILFCSFYSLDKFIREEKILSNGLFSFLSLLLLALIDQSRMLIVTFIITFVLLIFKAKIGRKKKLSFIVATLFLLICFLFTPFANSIFSLLNKTSADTSEIRAIGRTFYLDTLKQSPILSGGFVNTDWELSIIGARMNEFIFANDNGIFGFLFYYGLIGLLYIFFLYFFLIKKSYFIYKKTKNISLFTFIVFSLIGSYSVYSFGMSAHIGFPIILILLEVYPLNTLN